MNIFLIAQSQSELKEKMWGSFYKSDISTILQNEMTSDETSEAFQGK